MSLSLVNWEALAWLGLALLASVLFFRLYAAHDFREISIRLLRNRYENAPAPDLKHGGRHTVRIIVCVLLGLLVGRFSWATIPAIAAVAGIGYLIFDPALNRDRDLPWDYSGSGNNWDRFWLWLTKRQQPAERWSAYVEAFILLLMLTWYFYLTYGTQN